MPYAHREPEAPCDAVLTTKFFRDAIIFCYDKIATQAQYIKQFPMLQRQGLNYRIVTGTCEKMLQAHLAKQQADPGLPPLQYTEDCFSLLRAANSAALYQPTHGEKDRNI